MTSAGPKNASERSGATRTVPFVFLGADALPRRAKVSRHTFARPKAVDDSKPYERWECIYEGDYRPFPKQLVFLETIREQAAKYGRVQVGFGGAPGPGKTMALAFACIEACLKYPGYRWYVGRYNREDLEESTVPKFIEVLDELKRRTGLQYEFITTKWRITLFNGPKGTRGSVIKFIELKDPTKIKGGECDGYAIDEASDVPRAARVQLAQRLRGSIKNPRKKHGASEAEFWPLMELWASNPGPGWCYNDYYLPWRAKAMPEGRAFIRATWKDNPRNPPDYAENILATDPTERTAALINGDWAAMPGQVYPEFSRTKHVRDFDIRKITGQSMDSIRILGSYDWGKAHNTAILASTMAVDPEDGALKCWIFDAYVRPGGEIEDHAAWMQQFDSGINECIWYADRSVQTQVRDGIEDKITEEFEQDYGISLVPANEGSAKYSARKGVVIVKRLLKMGAVVIRKPPEDDDDTADGLEKLIHSMETFCYPVDPVTGEMDRRKFQESAAKDAADAMRYLLINIVEEIDLELEGEQEALREKAAKMSPRRRLEALSVNVADARRLGLSYQTIARARKDQRKTQRRAESKFKFNRR